MTLYQSGEEVEAFGSLKADAIYSHTRARCSHANFMLNELETFLLERDSEDDLLNVDDEAKYQEFLSVVLSYV